MKHFSKILIRPIVTEKMTALQKKIKKMQFKFFLKLTKKDVKNRYERSTKSGP